VKEKKKRMYFLKNELELSRVSQNYFQFVLAREKIYLLLFKKEITNIFT